jgi:integrase
MWKACGAIDAANLSSIRFGSMFRLMLLTGCRRNEVAGMSDSEIKGNVWTLPAERAKNGKELRVHLTKTALAILKSIPRIVGCAYVFGPTGAKCGFGFSKAKERLDAETKIETPLAAARSAPHLPLRTRQTRRARGDRRTLHQPSARRPRRHL